MKHQARLVFLLAFCISLLLASCLSRAEMVMHGGINVATKKIPKKNKGYSKVQIAPANEQPDASDIGAFRTTCWPSHMLFDDPIVYPGEPGRAHLHTFYGNTGTNANSTAKSIKSYGNSTCRGGTANRSAYWHPSMIDTTTGTPLMPDVVQIYYKQGYEITPSTAIHRIPKGLRMIAGDPTLSGPGAPGYFDCVQKDGNEVRRVDLDCPAETIAVRAVINFQQCWDGKNLDSPDHKSHMSGPDQLQSPPWTKYCPEAHPVPIPQVSYQAWFWAPNGTKGWRLASDMYDPAKPGGYSWHADYFEGWKEEVIETWTKNCVQAQKDCHSHLLGDGRAITGDRP